MYLPTRYFISIEVQKEATVFTNTDHRSIPGPAIVCHFGYISKHSNPSVQQPASCDSFTNAGLFSGFSAKKPGVMGCVRTRWSPVDV